MTTTSTSRSAGSGRGPCRVNGPRLRRRNGSVRTRTPPILTRAVACPRKRTSTLRFVVRASGGLLDDRVTGAAGDLAEARGMPEQRHESPEERARGGLDQV